MYDASTGDSYATCYAEMKVKPGRDNPATDWAFLGGGGLASLVLAGYIYRKRRVTTMTTDSLDRCQESDDTTVTHFELVSDPICKV